jgi:L-lysine 6-transaminase
MTKSTITAAQVHSTLSRHMMADGFDIVLDLDRSTGAYLYDAVTGKRYLDFFTFFASDPIHCQARTRRASQAIELGSLHG